MLSARLYRLVVAVTIVALMGSMTVQAMPPSAFAAMDGSIDMADECPRMATMHSMHHSSMPATPRKGNPLDCIKQMGCLGTAGLPVGLSLGFAPLTYDAVTYWAPDAASAGRTIKPDLLPPIGS